MKQLRTSPARRTSRGARLHPAAGLLRRLGALIAVATALVPATGAFGATSADEGHAGVGVRLVDAPAASSDDPRARVYIIDHVAPGTQVERRIEVSNDTGAATQVAVYPAGASVEGGAFVGLDADTPNELSSWTSVSTSTLDLADGDTRLVNVSIDVPADAAPGEQYAVIWASMSAGDQGGPGVTQVSRVGIRIYLSVGAGGAPAADFTIESLTAARSDAGLPLVLATIHNTGGRALDLSGTLTLSGGPGGLSAGPFPVSAGSTLGLDMTEPVSIELDEELPNGPWDAELTITSGLLSETAQATITFPESAGVGETVPVDSGPSALWWWGAGAVLVIGCAAASISILHRRRHRSALTPRDPGQEEAVAQLLTGPTAR